MLECGLCDRPFPVIVDLHEHQRKVHHSIPNENQSKNKKDKFTYNAFDTEDKENIAPNFKCGICSRSFPFRSKLIRHIDASHSSKGSKGDERRRSIDKSNNLKKHIKGIHKGLYKCDRCEKNFAFPLGLKLHKKNHLNHLNH